MLIRISLIVAIIAGLAVGALNFVTVKDKLTSLIAERDSERSQKVAAQTELDTTKKTLAQTEKDLAQTKETLAATSKERDDAVADAAEKTKRAAQLTAERDTARKEREEAQGELAAYKQSGFTPEQVMNLGKTLRQSQLALEESQEVIKAKDVKIANLTNRLAIYESPVPPPVYLPAKLTGKILVADPKWDFVVLDVGSDQGLLERGELLVNRNGKLVAKIRVTSVQKERSIANVLPDWKLGDVLEGDQVIPAYPSS